MDLTTALRMLPEQQHERFRFDVFWWQNYYQDPYRPLKLFEVRPEQWAVEMAFRNMRGEDVLFRFRFIRDDTTELGYRVEGDHWCRGWYYCLRCYGD